MTSAQVIMDTKSGDKSILIDKAPATCKGCDKTLEEGTQAYFADFERAMYCKKCIMSGRGSNYNTTLYWGVIKIKGGR